MILRRPRLLAVDEASDVWVVHEWYRLACEMLPWEAAIDFCLPVIGRCATTKLHDTYRYTFIPVAHAQKPNQKLLKLATILELSKGAVAGLRNH